ncbi:putative kinase [Klebsiella quasipneumoniae]|nr:putative kinase [Klebsiella quasipneumoniae]
MMTTRDDNSLPDSWVTGAIVEIKAPTNYLISTSSGYSVFASPLLTELAPVAGMPVTLSFNSVDYDLVIASLYPGSGCRYLEWVVVRPKNSVQCRSCHLRLFDQRHHVHDHMAGHHLCGVAGSELHLDVGTAGGHHRGAHWFRPGRAGQRRYRTDNRGGQSVRWWAITSSSLPAAVSVMPRFTPPVRHQPAAARR